MKAQFLGEFDVLVDDTPFVWHTPVDWVLYYLENYGQIEGAHHKAWVLDQVTRILYGTEVHVKVAKWDKGSYEYRVQTGEPSKAYKAWVELYKNGGKYNYGEGIAP